MASAFLTDKGFRWFSNLLSPAVSAQIIVRWRLNDLLCGASSLGVYEAARARKYDFRVNGALHAKVWLIDMQHLFVGSANATGRGLSLIEDGNIEFGARLVGRPVDLKILEDLISGSVPITAQLFAKLADYVAEVRQNAKSADNIDWPLELQKQIAPPKRHIPIYASDCLLTDGAWIGQASYVSNRMIDHDLSLLGAPSDPVHCPNGRDLLVASLEGSKIYRWLLRNLAEEEGREAYFGNLSARLQNELADDPTPSRQTVKMHLANLFGWIETLAPPSIKVDRPQFSQRARMLI